MAINFPSTPNVGDTYVVGLKTYTWDGVKWGFNNQVITSGTSAQRPTVSKAYVYYNTTLRSYEVYLPEYGRWEVISTYAVTENPTVGYSEAVYTTPGTYSWVCPAGVAYVNVVCVGGGTGFRSGTNAGGATAAGASGAGGGLGWKNNIAVTPGNSYTVVVGAGGVSIAATTNGSTNPGGNSYFISTSTVMGQGGKSGTFTTVGLGGGYVGDGGGNGGDANPSVAVTIAPGGGGAGGYAGNGGNGAYYAGASVSATAGTGGGGGGGGRGDYSVTYGYYAAAAGGGVGILGQGTSGAAGTNATSTSIPVISRQGYGGSVASPTGTYGGEGGVSGAMAGGKFGGGAGVAYNTSALYNGGGGAVRIIWGQGRAFPSTNTGVI